MSDERHHAGVEAAESGDDRGQGAGQFRADQQKSFLVALGRHDLQQRYQLASLGQGVGDQGQMGQLQEFLDP